MSQTIENRDILYFMLIAELKSALSDAFTQLRKTLAALTVPRPVIDALVLTQLETEEKQKIFSTRCQGSTLKNVIITSRCRVIE